MAAAGDDEADTRRDRKRRQAGKPEKEGLFERVKRAADDLERKNAFRKEELEAAERRRKQLIGAHVGDRIPIAPEFADQAFREQLRRQEEEQQEAAAARGDPRARALAVELVEHEAGAGTPAFLMSAVDVGVLPLCFLWGVNRSRKWLQIAARSARLPAGGTSKLIMGGLSAASVALGFLVADGYVHARMVAHCRETRWRPSSWMVLREPDLLSWVLPFAREPDWYIRPPVTTLVLGGLFGIMFPPYRVARFPAAGLGVLLASIITLLRGLDVVAAPWFNRASLAPRSVYLHQKPGGIYKTRPESAAHERAFDLQDWHAPLWDMVSEDVRRGEGLRTGQQPHVEGVSNN